MTVEEYSANLMSRIFPQIPIEDIRKIVNKAILDSQCREWTQNEDKHHSYDYRSDYSGYEGL